ncbi:hypothetical protein FSP39_009762 [Pinctada imbricata]|uniref:Uncharacterized protein n=1 Tax=Pinctada imbricata TaxID=66713 RepID=A0AA89BW38_PINIB|nr:hypothetical protein FSP39_009762 [Pinctada imbricata]
MCNFTDSLCSLCVIYYREHEWTKHGTCATSLAATGDIHKYFSKALELKSRYDATKLLSNQGINPDNKTTYPIDAVEAAMKRELSANALVMCAYDEKTKQQLMYEVEICLNKDFNPVDCYPDTDENSSGKRHSSYHKYPHKPTSNCPHKYGFYYLPIPGMYTVDKHTGFKRDSEMHFKDLDYYLRRWKLIKDKLVSNMEESNNESY